MDPKKWKYMKLYMKICIQKFIWKYENEKYVKKLYMEVYENMKLWEAFESKITFFKDFS